MSEKNFLSWLGFKEEEVATTKGTASSNNNKTPTAASGGTFDRIRELEAELADLRSRRDISGLTREEFEILATETAMTLIKTAQAREAKAVATAKSALNEAGRAVKQLTEAAESKAHSVLQSAEGRGRKYIETAEREAKEAIEKATRAAQELLAAKNREASTITSAARREAERAKAEAILEIANFKNWLGGAVTESERLQKLHLHALSSAEEAIRQTKTKVALAYEKLAALGVDIESALDDQDRPKEKDFSRPQAEVKIAPQKGVTRSNSGRTTTGRTTTTRKSVGNKPKRK